MLFACQKYSYLPFHLCASHIEIVSENKEFSVLFSETQKMENFREHVR